MAPSTIKIVFAFFQGNNLFFYKWSEELLCEGFNEIVGLMSLFVHATICMLTMKVLGGQELFTE